MPWRMFIAEKRLLGVQVILANQLMRLCHKPLFRLPLDIVGWAFMPTRSTHLKKQPKNAWAASAHPT